MNLPRSVLVFVLLILIVALPSGGVLHSALPHEHSHTPGAIDASWISLHALLRGEEKKMLSVITTAFIFSIFAAVMFYAGRQLLPVSLVVHARRKRRYDSVTDALRTGIVAYRRFG